MLGDLSANVEKLKSQLRLLKFPMKNFMEQGVATGKAVAFLPILHYVFFDFSSHVRELLQEKGYDALFCKSDLRFVEELYRFLRTELNVRPTVSTAQVFCSDRPRGR